ncbi:MAG: hypothetical protein J6R06_04745 [Bacteroidales bacterium]|nr:hypothetical protein [Bacteroidales bacterium]
MEKLFNVIPECFIDTNLIEFLLNAKVNHQHSCNNVIKALNNKKDEFAIGIIDNDKRKVAYIKDCKEIIKTKHLILFKHKERNQYLITISPAADGFILDCTREQGVDVSHFGLPINLKDFLKETKTITSNKDQRFKKLFKEIKNHKEISLLQKVLTYLCENKYQSDVEEIKKF